MVRPGSGRFGVGFWVGFWVGIGVGSVHLATNRLARARDATGGCSRTPLIMTFPRPYPDLALSCYYGWFLLVRVSNKHIRSRV